MKHTTTVHSEEPARVRVDVDGGGIWFRVFADLVRSGLWATLSPSAGKVLMVLFDHVNEEIRGERGEWLAWPSASTIARFSGVSRPTVFRALAELEKAGLVRRRTSGGGASPSTYQLLRPPVSPMRPVSPVRRVSRVRPDPSHGRDCTRLTSETQLRMSDRDEKKTTTAAGVAAAADSPAAPAQGGSPPATPQGEPSEIDQREIDRRQSVIDALIIAGIEQDRTRQAIAANPRLTGDVVRRVEASVRAEVANPSKRPGAIVSRLRHYGEVDKARARQEDRRHRRDLAIAGLRRRQEREETIRKAEHERLFIELANVSTDEMRAAIEAALDGEPELLELPAAGREALRRTDWRTNEQLMPMLERWLPGTAREAVK